MITLSRALAERIKLAQDDATKHFNRNRFEYGAMLCSIVYAAAYYWTYACDAHEDFIVSFDEVSGLQFGKKNRLFWSAGLGFFPARKLCTEAFLAHYDKLGPTPYAGKTNVQ